jgi:fructose-bisphosphate aldolase, class II
LRNKALESCVNGCARLREVRAKAQGRVRIALHGTNGFKPDLMKKCISEGVAKVNVNKLVLNDYSEHLKENAGKVPQTKLMEQGVEMVVRQTMQWMEICGSAGKVKSNAGGMKNGLN